MTRRRRWTWLLFVAFVVVPLLEIYVLIQVGQVIGVWWTILLLVADAILGSWLLKREGRRAFDALRTALSTGRMPAHELADGILIVAGGTLMLSPGFVTDLLGLALILPLTRPLARRFLTTVVARRLLGSAGGGTGRGSATGFGPGPGFGAWTGPARPGTRSRTEGPTQARPGDGEGPVVRGEVVDD